jgi:hypothetical protein
LEGADAADKAVQAIHEVGEVDQGGEADLYPADGDRLELLTFGGG